MGSLRGSPVKLGTMQRRLAWLLAQGRRAQTETRCFRAAPPLSGLAGRRLAAAVYVHIYIYI